MRIFALLLVLAAILPAQEFEVASIRAAKDDGDQGIDTDRGRFVAHNLTLKRLIARAWDVEESEVLGGPVWIDSDSYDINAKIPEGQWTRERVLQMLRRLLTDRFQLAVHREARQVSGYVLAVAKTGPKMTAARPGPDDSNTSSDGRYLKAMNVTMELLARRLSRNR